MKFMETRRYEMLVRVRDFGAANGDRFPHSTLVGKTFAVVSSTVNDLAGLAGTQLAAQGNANANAKAAARARSGHYQKRRVPLTMTDRSLPLKTCARHSCWPPRGSSDR